MRESRVRAALMSAVVWGAAWGGTGCNLSDEVERPQAKACQEGQERGQERCQGGRWVMIQPSDMAMVPDQSRVDMAPDMTIGPDLGPDMSVEPDMPPKVCDCQAEQVCLFETCMNVERVINPRQLPDDAFGAALAMDGQWLAVGAPTTEGTRRAGIVTIFRRVEGAWKEFAQLSSPEALRGRDGFGSALAFSQGRLFVGAPEQPVSGSSQSGRLYVYTLSVDPQGEPVEWKPLEPHSPKGQDGQRYGSSVATRAAETLVGMPGAGVNGLEQVGAAVLDCLGAQLCNSATLTSARDSFLRPLLRSGARMGESVALTGVAAWAGAPYEASEQGAVIGWERPLTSRSAPALLAMPEAKPKSRFGHAMVTTPEDHLIISAPRREDEAGAPAVGRVYVFSTSGRMPTLIEEVRAAQVGPEAEFGFALATADATLLVGAPGLASTSGRAYLYRFDPNTKGHVLAATLSPPQDNKQRFGAALLVDLASKTLVIGAPADDGGPNAPGTGSILIYSPADPK